MVMNTALPTEPTLGNFIREKRKELGITRAELARRSGLPATTLLRIEHGERKHPATTTLKAIAKGLNVPIDVILEKDGVRKTDPHSVIQQAYPELTDPKQWEAMDHYARALARNAKDLTSEDIDKSLEQIDMSFEYAKSKKKSK